jgi:hypothetical protein
VVSAGLHLTDLNLFDSTSDLLITGMQQERAIEDAFAKVSTIKKCETSYNNLGIRRYSLPFDIRIQLHLIFCV